ncbi:hypothetical protein LOAG_08609 [Loa loa]|uniref:Uncharacterized protein n=1 Tax=Loa loa TaxID=7209 RepID=A0A1S0TV26_LOALO|nr:hypothetical protein LOAG_08609 [Loa loa]EFO19883.2 hypothetical protein LOAG_08609 [Loa loa]
MQISSNERCKQNYKKHHEHRRCRKKYRPISLSTITENYAVNSFPRSTMIDDRWTVEKEMLPNGEGSSCKCKNCTLGRIMITTSNFKPSLFSGHPEYHSTPV